VPRVPIASGGAPECRPSTLDTPPRAAARHPDGCGATARNTSLVRPTGSPHRWVSSLRRPRAPQRRVRASWPRLASEQGCLRAARPGVLALGVLAPRTFVCAHEGTGSSHLPRARFVVHERLSAGCAPHGRAWRLSRAACGQPGCFGSGCFGSTHIGVRARGDGQLAPMGELAPFPTSASAPGARLMAALSA